MSRLPFLLFVAAFAGAACGDTVPLNNQDSGGAGQGATGGDPAAPGGAGGPEDGGAPNPAGAGAGTLAGTAGASSGTAGTAPSAGTAGSTAGTDGVGGNAGHGGDEAAGTSGAGGTGGSAPSSVCATSANSPVVSGSRLKALCVVSAADGSQIPKRGKLFDAQLGAECSYRAAADGTWRCLPTLHNQADITASVGFSDANCTQRVTWFDLPTGGCTADLPKHVYQVDSPPYCGIQDGLEQNTRVFPLGALIAQPTPLYSKSGASCTGIPAPLNKVFYAVGSELPATDFVAGTRGVTP